MNETPVASTPQNSMQEKGPAWIELAVKLGAVLIGSVYVCGFLNMLGYLSELGIASSEVSLVNAVLLDSGAILMYVFCAPFLFPALIVVAAQRGGEERSFVLFAGVLATAGFTIGSASMAYQNYGFRHWSLAIYILAEVFISGILVQGLTARGSPAQAFPLISRVFFLVFAVLGLILFSDFTGRGEVHAARHTGMPRVQLLVEPPLVPELSEAGLKFAAGSRLSYPIDLVHTSEHSYFVRPDGGSVVEIARDKVLLSVRPGGDHGGAPIWRWLQKLRHAL